MEKYMVETIFRFTEKKKVKHYLSPSKNVITFLVRNDLTHTKDLQT